jgi:hypothetical protein
VERIGTRLGRQVMPGEPAELLIGEIGHPPRGHRSARDTHDDGRRRPARREIV